jgi:cbb3-type cytochrome oxidase subunit 3
MRLSEIMSSMGLAIYPTIALLLFFPVFIAVIARAYSRRLKPELDRAASLPLADTTSNPAAPEDKNVKA